MKISELASLLGIEDLEGQLVQVDAGLERALRSSNAYLFQPGMRVVQGGGKRLRPVLTLAAARSDGTPEREDDVISGAVSVELVHVGSLVHDDIIDDATERRGVPTVNAVEGASHAILVGDYLLARAGVEAARISNEVAGVLAQTIADLCDGQSRETVDLFNTDRAVESLLDAIRGKTAALMRASCRIGALCGGLSQPHVDALSRYGEAFGMAFQLVDDVLDIVSTKTAMGKPVGNDLKEGVYTLPVLHALRGNGGEDLRNSLGKLIDDPGLVTQLINVVKASGGVEETIDLARAYNEKAAAELTVLPATAVVKGLAHLPSAYLDWALTEKTAGGYSLTR